MVRRILSVLTLVAIALPAFAQERFIIERIDVRNAQHVSPRVIVDETLLLEGKEYSEDDVRASVARLKHLPFLVSADFALENGKEEGRRVLVINVTEVKRVSFFVNGRAMMLDTHRSNKIDYDFDRPGESNDAIDVRWFVGGRGVAHFAMAVRRSRQFERAYSSWELGYTQYDLFGTRAFATINLRTPVDSVNEGRYTPQLIAGIPLTTSQTLTVDYTDTSFVRDTIHLFGNALDQLHAERVVTLAWTYDTTDQPFAPMSGTFLRVAPLRVMTDRASYLSVPRTPAYEPYAEHLNTNGIDVAAIHYWKLSEVNSVSGGILGGWGTIEDRRNPPPLSSIADRRPKYEIAQVGYSHDLRNGQSKGGVSRLELEGRVVMQQQDVQNPFAADNERSVEVSASWVRRSVWGTLRLSAGYEQDQ